VAHISWFGDGKCSRSFRPARVNDFTGLAWKLTQLEREEF
jgi:hypothetical protein